MYKNSDTCLEKSQDDEPIFVLVARDVLAIKTIQSWIGHAERYGVGLSKIHDARRVIAEMHKWQRENQARIPD